MNQPPPYVPPVNPRRDDENLNLLAIFHYVMAGILSLGIIFIIFHYMVVSVFVLNPEIWEANSASSGGGPSAPPAELGMMIRGMYTFSALVVVILVGINIAAARFLKKRKNRTFILIVSGFNCMNLPFGTALGIFAFIVLMKPHIADLFERNKEELAGTVER